jgi:hypothetical protein
MATLAADLPAEANAWQRVSFYFSAHEDDWQLFMNPSAFRDVLDGGTKVVFVHVTAGDAGFGTGSGGRKYPYYLARENGTISAIRFMVHSDNRAPTAPAAAPMTFNAHLIYRVTCRNTVAYFLRLPDGSPAGDGYPDTGNQSLKRLAEGRIGTLTAIDGTTTYRDWDDLVATLRSVLVFERGAADSIDLHIPDLDPEVNPDDHPDHVMSAKLALAAAEGLSGARRLHHPGYACGAQPENLSGYDRDMKCAVYAVTVASVMAFDHGMFWQHYDQAFVGRDCCRRTR